MKHPLVLFGLGLVLGVAVAQLFPNRADPGLADSRHDGGWVAPPEPRPGRLQPAPPAAGNTGEGFGRRADVYALAGRADRNEIEALLDQLSTRRDSPGRRFSAQALLSRYLEIDPEASLAWARKLRLPSSIFAGLYAQWAETDAEAALFGLRFETELSAVQAIGDALVEMLGGSEAAIQRVADALPMDLDRASFIAGAYAALARREPEGTWLQVTALADPQLRLRAQQRVVAAIMERDPAAALARAGQIDDRTVRQAASKAVLDRWVQRDPAATLEYLASVGPDVPMDWTYITGSAYAAIAVAEPMLLLQSIERLPSADRATARMHALNRWAKIDPTAALSYAASRPTGEQRRWALTTAGRAYARIDAQGALNWALNVQPPSAGLVGTVLASVSVKSPAQAFDMARDLQSPEARSQAVQQIAMHLASNGQAAMAADRILAMADGNARREALGMLGDVWASQDPEAALNWYAANQSTLGAEDVQRFTANAIRRNPQQAARLIDQVAAELRPEWMGQVAAGFAESDPAAARAWLSRFQGEPGYDRAAANVAVRRVGDDPREMIDLMATINDPQLAGQVATRAAHAWARTDPAAAAEWAASLAQDKTRSDAVAQVAQVWSRQQPAAARSWILGLARGLPRDAAITNYLAANTGANPDAGVLSAYSSDNARQLGVQQTVFRLARQDPEAARQLIDEYLTDPTLRQRAEQALAASR